MLPSLHIENFKGFSNLQIERLGRVNLIVGKNNAGKSSLLEAIYLYASQGVPDALIQMLRNRHELRTWAPARKAEAETAEIADPNPIAFARLFHGCYSIDDLQALARIGPLTVDERTLTMEIKWDTVQIDGKPVGFFYPPFISVSDQRPLLEITVGHELSSRIFLDLIWNIDYRRILRGQRTRRKVKTQPVMVPPSGFDDEQLARLWDRIAATDLEQDALDALRLIDSRVERLYFVKEKDQRFAERTAVLRLRDVPVQVPLRHLGDGMNRVLGMILALVHSEGGMVLIDEIENGIHYSVQPDFLKLLFKLSADLNVQVFATTHSWDCIEAFQEAAAEDSQEGYLVRLHRENNEVQATVFDEKLLAVVTRQDIEVR